MLPPVGMVTDLVPVDTPHSPDWATATDTVRADAGAGSAVTVKPAVPPSVTPRPAVMLTSGAGSGGGGGGSSSSAMATVAAPLDADTV